MAELNQVCWPQQEEPMRKVYKPIEFKDLAVQMTVRALMKLLAEAPEGAQAETLEGEVSEIGTDAPEFKLVKPSEDPNNFVIIEMDDVERLEQVTEEADEAAPAAKDGDTLDYAAPVPEPTPAPVAAVEPVPELPAATPVVAAPIPESPTVYPPLRLVPTPAVETAPEAIPEPIPVLEPTPTPVAAVVPEITAVTKYADLTADQQRELLDKLNRDDFEAREYLRGINPEDPIARGQILWEARQALSRRNLVPPELREEHPAREPDPVAAVLPSDPEEDQEPASQPTQNFPRPMRVGAGIVLALIILALIVAFWPKGDKVTETADNNPPIPAAATMAAPNQELQFNVDLREVAQRCFKTAEGSLTMKDCEKLAQSH